MWSHKPGEVGIAYHRQPYSLAPSHQEPIVVTRYLAGVDDDDIDSFIDIVTHPTVPTYIHTAVPTYHVVLGKLVRKGAGPLPIPLHSDTLPPCLPPTPTPAPTPSSIPHPRPHPHPQPHLRSICTPLLILPISQPWHQVALRIGRSGYMLPTGQATVHTDPLREWLLGG